MRYMNAGERLLTAEDVLAPGFGHGELWDGVFVAREPSGGWSSTVELRVGHLLLGSEAVEAGGWVFGANQGFLVARDPDRVLAPDASWMSKERLPMPPARGFVAGAPDLAVEVRSPSDTWLATIEKGGVWIGHGVSIVWCIDPRTQSIVEMRPGQASREHGVQDELDLSPLVNEAFPIAQLFRGLRTDVS